MVILQWNKIAGKAAFHAARDTKTRQRPLQLHGHDFAEIFWIDAGEGSHRVNGQTFPLKPGSLVFIRPTDWHGLETTGEVRLTNVAFPAAVLPALQAAYFPREEWAFAATEKYPETREVEPGQLRRLNGWADELAESPRQRLYLDRFLLNVLAEVNRKREDVTLEEAPYWLVEACRVIRSPGHFTQGVEEFLRLCGRSREHVARTVQRYLHTTPTDYVNDLRMAYAQRQLEMGDQTVLEIALECGTENLSHFYGLFRKRTGMTPRRYRLMHRKPL